MKLTAAILAALLTCAAAADAATIVVFGQSGGTNYVTGNETGGVTTISAEAPSTLTTLNEAASGVAATFTLNATSSGAATNVVGDLWQQPYDGSFSLLGAGGFNYLSGVFSGIMLGLEEGGTLIFGAAQPPGSLTFTSDVAGMPLDDPTAMALSFTNAIPVIHLTNGSFGDFTANVSGTFSADEDIPVVPEPATMVLLGTGLLAAFRARARRA